MVFCGIFGHILKVCCPVSQLHSELWSLELKEMAAIGIAAVDGGCDFFVSVSGNIRVLCA